MTNIVAFFETQSKEKHVKYFQLDWKNIVESKFYQSNPNNFSTANIGIYQAICVDAKPNTLQIQHIPVGDAVTHIVYRDDDAQIKQKSNKSEDGLELECVDIDINGGVADDIVYQRHPEQEVKSRDDMDIKIASTENFEPPKSMKHSKSCKSGIVANFEAMTAMMNQMTDYSHKSKDSNKMTNKAASNFPRSTQIKTYSSQHVRPRKRAQNDNEIQLGACIDADIRQRPRIGSISAPHSSITTQKLNAKEIASNARQADMINNLNLNLAQVRNVGGGSNSPHQYSQSLQLPTLPASRSQTHNNINVDDNVTSNGDVTQPFMTRNHDEIDQDITECKEQTLSDMIKNHSMPL